MLKAIHLNRENLGQVFTKKFLIVILISGLVATFGFNYIPYKAYVIVAALFGLFVAMILTKMIKKK